VNKQNIFSFILLDVLVLALSAGLFVFRLSSIENTKHTAPSPAPAAPATAKPAAIKDNQEDALNFDEELSQAKPAEEEQRNVAFTFRHSKVKKVEIIGDFNDWIPQSLVKGKDSKWAISLKLRPGEYAYNYVVDGKPIKDPNNQKVCDAGRGFVNSYLKVKPASAENK